MRNIVILNSLHFSYPLPILMRVSYNTLIVKQNTSDYYKYNYFFSINEFVGHFGRFAALRLLESPTDLCDRESNGLFEEAADKGGNVGDLDDLDALRRTIQRGEG